MIFVFIASGCIYLVMNLLWFIVLKKPLKRKNKIKKKNQPNISIVVAAKNEEQNIHNLIHSIYENEYDPKDFEVIVVDDQSTDNTQVLVKKLQNEFDNLELLSSINKPYPGKKGALAIGITKSKYEYILITDADCIVSKKWIETFANEFSNQYDFVFGAAPLTIDLHELNCLFELDNEKKKRFLSRGLLRNDSLKDNSNEEVQFDPPQTGKKSLPLTDRHFDLREKSHSQLDIKSFYDEPGRNKINFISKLSCFENLRSSILTFAAAKLSLPYSAAARSFGFKKSSFEKLDGYSRTTETLSGDDDLLLREAVKAKMKIGCIIEPDAFVFSETKKTFRDYLIQKSRHTKTATHYLFKSQMMLGLWHITNLLLLAAVFLIPVDSVYLLFFLMKLSVDALVVLSLQKKFGYDFNFLKIILLQPVYEVMLVVNFIAGMILPDKWRK